MNFFLLCLMSVVPTVRLSGPPTVAPSTTATLGVVFSGESAKYTGIQFSVANLGWSISGGTAVAGKYLFCGVDTCMIVGSSSPLPDGMVALLRFAVPQNARGKKTANLTRVVATRLDASDGAPIQAGAALTFNAAPDCSHQLGGYPVGDFVVFVNGLKGKLGKDYTVTQDLPAPLVIHPSQWDTGWEFSVMYFRRISTTVEDWTCQ